MKYYCILLLLITTSCRPSRESYANRTEMFKDIIEIDMKSQEFYPGKYLGLENFRLSKDGTAFRIDYSVYVEGADGVQDSVAIFMRFRQVKPDSLDINSYNLIVD